MKNNNKFDMVPQGREHYRPLGIFDPFFDDFFDMPMFDRHEMHKMNNIMKTDVKESEKDYTLEIELPGIDKRDVNIDLRDGYLTISAKREHKQDDQDKKGNYIRRERSFGNFSRSFYIGDVDKKDIEASLDGGILKIVLPKQEKKDEGSNRIEIK